MCIKSEFRAIFGNIQPVVKTFLLASKNCPQALYTCTCVKQQNIMNNEAEGIFLELVQNDGNSKSFKMLQELVPSGFMPMPWGFFFQMMTLG